MSCSASMAVSCAIRGGLVRRIGCGVSRPIGWAVGNLPDGHWALTALTLVCRLFENPAFSHGKPCAAERAVLTGHRLGVKAPGRCRS